MEFYHKFVDRFQDMSKVKNPAVSKRSSNYLEFSKETFWQKYNTVTLTMAYLEVLHDMLSQSSYINFSDAAIMS